MISRRSTKIYKAKLTLDLRLGFALRSHRAIIRCEAQSMAPVSMSCRTTSFHLTPGQLKTGSSCVIKEAAGDVEDQDHHYALYRLKKALYGLNAGHPTGVAMPDAGSCGDVLRFRRSTSGCAQFLSRLVSCSSKKQTLRPYQLRGEIHRQVALVWMLCSNPLDCCSCSKDYGFDFNKIPLYGDIQKVLLLFSVTNIQHSRSKHI
ncbi:hypothetical protein Tco_0374020 [Tanacetum coccineum]